MLFYYLISTFEKLNKEIVIDNLQWCGELNKFQDVLLQ